MSSRSRLFAVPIPVVITAHIRADDSYEAVAIAQEAFDGLKFNLRDGMDVGGVPVSGNEQASSLPDISLSPHVVACGMQFLEVAQDITGDPRIFHGQDNTQPELNFPFRSLQSVKT